jgi:integrase
VSAAASHDIVVQSSLSYQRPYDLRHSFASLLLHEGRSVIYVARQLGHSAQPTMNTYGHVIDDLEEAPRVSAEDAIMAARRGEDVRSECVEAN